MNGLFFHLGLYVVLIIITSTSAQAQVVSNSMKFRLLAGLAAPTGAFSSTDGKTAGYATSNFCTTIEGSDPINKYFNWMTSISLAINGLDANKISKPLTMKVSSGNYLTIWCLTGIGFETLPKNGLKFYGLFQGGLLFSSFPDITFSDDNKSTTRTGGSGSGFALGTGAGVIIDKFSIDIKYVTSKPEYSQSDGFNDSSEAVKITLPAKIILLEAGYNF